MTLEVLLIKQEAKLYSLYLWYEDLGHIGYINSVIYEETSSAGIALILLWVWCCVCTLLLGCLLKPNQLLWSGPAWFVSFMCVCTLIDTVWFETTCVCMLVNMLWFRTMYVCTLVIIVILVSTHVCVYILDDFQEKKINDQFIMILVSIHGCVCIVDDLMRENSKAKCDYL